MTRALELARELESLLEETASMAPASLREGPPSSPTSTRMARAMAAGLVDELEALVRGSRSKTSVA